MSDINIDDISSIELIGSRKNFSFLLFFVLLIGGIIPAILYFLYYSCIDNNIFLYKINFKDNTTKYQEFKKNDDNLKKILDCQKNNE